MEPLISIIKQPNVSDSLTLSAVDVILQADQDYNWTFSGLNVQLNHCQLDSLQLALGNDNPRARNPKIVINNSSFRSLVLLPETKAEIIDCYVDAKGESRPTLITAINSDIKIRNSKFLLFVNKNGPTILYAQNDCSVSLENSVFTGNQGNGGVLYLYDQGHIEIVDTTFNENEGAHAGAVFVQQHVTLYVTNCLFDKNSAANGGAVYAESNVTLTFMNTTFKGNKASSRFEGAAITIKYNSQVLITSCTMEENQVAINSRDNAMIEIYDSNFTKNQGLGGGGFVTNGDKVVKFEGCLFRENFGSELGGAIVGYFNVEMKIKMCKFVRNFNNQTGGAIVLYNADRISFEQSYITNNTASNSGAIHLENIKMAYFINSTFYGNKASSGDGGALSFRHVPLATFQEINVYIPSQNS